MERSIAEETFLAKFAAAKSDGAPAEGIPPHAVEAALDNALRTPQDQQSGRRSRSVSSLRFRR